VSKKTSYKAKHVFPVPLYGGEVHLMLSSKQMRAACKAYGMTIGTDGFAGHFARLERNGGKQRLYLIGIYDDGLSTLTHELGHAALDILEVAGIDAHAGNGEPFCYLFQHLFDQCAPAVAKKVMRT
jgi:hypothetical protein